jgi:L-amino acid N-acyltransferase YncA
VSPTSPSTSRASAAGGAWGRRLLVGLVEESERRGLWKLVGRVFPENEMSRVLCRAHGFREVGL